MNLFSKFISKLLTARFRWIQNNNRKGQVHCLSVQKQNLN